ncbi:MAG: hypothetical protein LBH17_01090 [Oscillospiraceae bacterium]|jgi:hypothetical protein|nr:hypothetical protein [Oscillospiraceae bacterium]
MKKHGFFVTLICVVTFIAAIATLAILFRDEICDFLAAAREKLNTIKSEFPPPDEYGDYADIE